MPATGELVVLPAPRNYHRLRKLIHLGCFLIFCLLPFSNLMRFDIPRQRFYFFGNELWINEFGIIFFSMMFLMFVIVVSSVVWGRIYCSYACPQMIFSEAANGLEDWLLRKITKHLGHLSSGVRQRLWRASFYALVWMGSVFLAFVFISYFVEPRDLLSRLMRLDMVTAGGISGAAVTVVTFLDFAFLRQRFCTTACPYGYLQGMLGDGNTLLVHYRDEKKACIECKKCLRVCHMGIDIRTSPFQIECIHCGECIDACDQIMGKLKKPGLIHYAWGEKGEALDAPEPWRRKLGIRDAKRVVVLLVTLFYLTGLSLALSMRRSVLVQVSPDRATLYRVDEAGVVYNKFRAKLANRGGEPVEVAIGLEGLPGAKLTLDGPVTLMPGESAELYFEVAAAPFPGAGDVNHFRIVARATAANEEERFDQTFLMPPEKTK